jgi:ATP-binding cassette subfamily F protein uup
MRTEDRRLESGFGFDATGRKTRRLLTAKGIGCTRGGRRLISGLDLLLKPGLRIGLVGGNGAGKTSLLKVLGGEQAKAALEAAEARVERLYARRAELDARRQGRDDQE